MNSWKEKYQNIMYKCRFAQNYSEPRTLDTTRRSDIFYVFVISGVIGFLAALLGRVTWQVAVESAQVVSGVVQYTNKSPFYLYHTKVWSLLVQLPAFFLYLGISERTLSIVISGIAGAFSFQALSLIIYAVSNKKLLALLSPMFIYITGMTSAFEGNYPIYLMGAPHTYGMIGLSFAILSLALIGSNYYRVGWIIAGVSPAIHPVIGALTLIAAIVAILWEKKDIAYVIKKIFPFLVIGLIICALSYSYQLFFIYDVPATDKNSSMKYVRAFIEFWDTHRAPVEPLSNGVLINILIILICLLAISKIGKILLGVHVRFLFRVFLILAVLGLLSVVLSWTPLHLLPMNLVVSGLMPARVLNFAAFGAPALLIGLLAVEEDTIWSKSLLVMMIVIPLVWHEVERNMDIVYPLMIFISVALIILMLKSSDRMIKRNQRTASIRQNLLALLNIVVIVLLVVVFAAGLMKGVLQARDRFSMLTNWANDRVYAEASKAKGMLLTALEMRLIQLKTRRPVLLDALNQIPYVPESAEPINNILQKIYGINLLAPPDLRSDVVQSAELLVNINKTTWEKRTYDEWTKIAYEFKVSDIITYKNWKLQLPIVADNDMMTLYRIESN
mgnify:CR=1 FL=1